MVSGVLLGATVLGGTAACGEEVRAGASPAPATSSASTGTTTPAGDPSTDRPEGRMTTGLAQSLVLTRTGGIGGVKDRVVVNPDGTAEVTTRGRSTVTRQLGEGQLATIVRATQAADLPALAADAAATTEPDRYGYVLSLGEATVRTSETQAKGAVRNLLDVLELLFISTPPTP